MPVPLTILFAGFTSTGKSTAINSLVGRAALRMGHTRTTNDVTVLGKQNTCAASGPDHFIEVEKLVSDDGHPFVAVDVPGLKDANETDRAGESDESITTKYLQVADIVLWVTDEHNALGKEPEVEAYRGVVAQVRKHTEKTGKLIQHGVVVSKYEGVQLTAAAKTEYVPRPGEVALETETTKEDSIVALGGKLESGSAPLMLFNAHGRVRHHPMYGLKENEKPSALQASVARSSPNVSNINTAFKLGAFHDNLWKKRKVAHLSAVRAFTKTTLHTMLQQGTLTALEYGSVFDRIGGFSATNRSFQFKCEYVQTILKARSGDMAGNNIVMWTILEMVVEYEGIGTVYPILQLHLSSIQLFWILYQHDRGNRHVWNKYLLQSLPTPNGYRSLPGPAHQCKCSKGNCTQWWTCSYQWYNAQGSLEPAAIPAVTFYVDVTQRTGDAAIDWESIGEVLPEDRRAVESPLWFTKRQKLDELREVRRGIWGLEAEQEVELSVVVNQYSLANIPSVLSPLPS